MRKKTGNYAHLIVWVLLTTLFAACGKSSPLVSSTAPVVFYAHMVALRNGTSYAWGANTYGQLGNNDTTGATQFAPQLVVGFAATGMAGISAGGTHTLAFKNNSSAYAWGNNGYGQLGNYTVTPSAVPVQVYKYALDKVTLNGPLTRVAAVSAGGNHSLAIVNDGTVWAWGDNALGQLGDGTIISRIAAVQIQNPLTGSPLVASLISAGGSHSLAMLANNTAMSWGYNYFGQLGNAVTTTPVFGAYSTSFNSIVPTVVVEDAPNYPTLASVTAIAAGGSHSLFITAATSTTAATVWSCGYNYWGQLGDGTVITRNHGVVPVIGLPTANGVTPIAVAAGLDHSLVLMSDGSVWAWGSNYSGQLGNGAPLLTITGVLTPVQVMVNFTQPLTGVTTIIAIGNNSFAVDSSGKLWAWGDNTFGQLGQGGTSTTDLNFATPVLGFSTGSVIYPPSP
jgi:alpha-tubulin suppressor-like RCC1 family protein